MPTTYDVFARPRVRMNDTEVADDFRGALGVALGGTDVDAGLEARVDDEQVDVLFRRVPFYGEDDEPFLSYPFVLFAAEQGPGTERARLVAESVYDKLDSGGRYNPYLVVNGDEHVKNNVGDTPQW